MIKRRLHENEVGFLGRSSRDGLIEKGRIEETRERYLQLRHEIVQQVRPTQGGNLASLLPPRTLGLIDGANISP